MNMRNALRSEDTEQISVMQWAEWNRNRYPELKWLHHVPNGGSRNKQEAMKLKQMGVKAGVADLCLPYPRGIYCGLYIEMKYGDGRQQDSQKEFLADMAAAGHYVATCYSAEEATAVIREYLSLIKRTLPNMIVYGRGSGKVSSFDHMMMAAPNNSIYKNGKIKVGETKQKKDCTSCLCLYCGNDDCMVSECEGAVVEPQFYDEAIANCHTLKCDHYREEGG